MATLSEAPEAVSAAVEAVFAVVVEAELELDCCLAGHAAAAEMTDKARAMDWHFMVTKEWKV